MSRKRVDSIHGYFVEQLAVGMSAQFEKQFSSDDVLAFANLSGDNNPLHLDTEFASSTRVGGPIVHGMLTTSLWSTIVGTQLPGPGCLYMSQSLMFLKPVYVGATVNAVMSVSHIDVKTQRVTLQAFTHVENVLVAKGEALVWVPSCV